MYPDSLHILYIHRLQLFTRYLDYDVAFVVDVSRTQNRFIMITFMQGVLLIDYFPDMLCIKIYSKI